MRARKTVPRLTRSSGRGDPGALAALEELRNGAAGEGGFDRLRSAALTGADPVDVALVGWELIFTAAPSKLSEKRARQFAAAAGQLDRLRRAPGSTAVQLLDMLSATRDLALVGAADWPGSLAYFTTALRQQARAERRRARGLAPVADTGQGEQRVARYRSSALSVRVREPSRDQVRAALRAAGYNPPRSPS